MSVVGRALVRAAGLRGLQLAAAGKNPRPAQERALQRLLARARSTAFGRVHRFASLRSPDAYRKSLPLHRYPDLLSYFERALAGEPDVCWPGRIQYFGMSSGTTAGNKYLPISNDSIRQQQRGGAEALFAYLRWTGDHELLDSRGILLGGSSQLTRRPSGVRVGDNTGVMAHHMPWLVRRQYLPSDRVREIEDWDRKIDALVREAVHCDVRLLAGTPSWFPGLFDRLLVEARRRGLRARHVHDVWPNLRLLTGGGINYEPYRDLVRSRLGRHVPYVDVYNATEGGIMGVQDRPDELAMQLLPDNGVYYEFVPVEELSASQPRRFALWEVETGVVYALAVSTMSGIFSYLIGDCLRFVEVFPHRFLFEGRTAAFLNVTGEHVSQGELERAIRHASTQLGVSLVDFTVGADILDAPECGARHVYFVEFDLNPNHPPRQLALPDPERFMQLVDSELSRGNGDYAAHRNSSLGLRPPVLQLLRPGAFHAFMKQRGKLGGQNKLPRVLLDPASRSSLNALSLADTQGTLHS